MDSRPWTPAIAAAVVGGALGAVVVWLSAPEPSPCTTLDNGMRACMPVLVVGPPPWLYVAAALLGAAVAAAATLGYAARRGHAR